MKRIALLACAVALVAAAAGCGPAQAGDGDLVDDWAMLAAAKVPEPAAGACWTTTATNVGDLGDVVLSQQPCDMDHVVETVSVGHFTGDAAKGSSRPKGAALAAAWTDCDKAVGDYLGGEWQSARVFVVVNPPSDRQWDGGARFYRCDIGALRSEAGTLEPRKATMKGAVAGDLKLGCGTLVGTTQNSWDDITPASCTDPHDAEYVGTVSSPVKEYPADEKAYDAAFGKSCETKMLSYIGMSHTSWGSQKALYYGYWMTGDEDEWAAGNHSARCYAMIDKKKINRSLKGAGDGQV
ncbi:septum formation family protein [Dactylosporangium sp. NPDC049140]|uniref:septum formation family protein n=1 Tax=Dactylosporangium sp. NPDC049140 TaxID=3155647 RepID=UPI003408C3C5